MQERAEMSTFLRIESPEFVCCLQHLAPETGARQGIANIES
jgi:hypothetical protein